MRSLRTLIFSLLTCWMFLSLPAQALKVGLVLDKGGKDDKSFNSSAYAGATKAQKELGIELKYVEATDSNAIETLHRAFATKGFDLIVGIGFAQADAVKKIAAQFPDRKFLLVDGEVNAPNVRSLLFEEHEGSYLMGVIAAEVSKTKAGFIGGMDIPLIRRFQMGYEAGVKKSKPQMPVVSNFIGITSEAWNNTAKAKELALAQFNSGVDVIFVAAGASNSGVFDAAEETKKFAIGCDSNQDWIKPGFILSSMLKRVDVAVYDSIKDAKDGHLTAGVVHYGLKDKGIDYSSDQYNEKILSADLRKKLDDIKTQIIAGKIKVPDYYKSGKK